MIYEPTDAQWRAHCMRYLKTNVDILGKDEAWALLPEGMKIVILDGMQELLDRNREKALKMVNDVRTLAAASGKTPADLEAIIDAIDTQDK